MLSMFCRPDSNGIHLLHQRSYCACAMYVGSLLSLGPHRCYLALSVSSFIPPRVILILVLSGLHLSLLSFFPHFYFVSYLFIQSFPFFTLCFSLVQYFVDFLFTPCSFLYFLSVYLSFPSLPKATFRMNALLSGSVIFRLCSLGGRGNIFGIGSTCLFVGKADRTGVMAVT
jgi:hypothetical protein